MNKEAELIARCKLGDPDAFSGLYNEHASAVYNCIIRLIRHTGEAEDILQECFVAAFLGISKFTYEGGFRAWVKRIAINKSIDSIRKRKIHFVALEAHLPCVSDQEEINEEEYAFTNHAILAAVESLPDRYRTIFVLYAVENIPQAEIAERLGMKHSTVRIQYFRAKQIILHILAEGTFYEQRIREIYTS